MQGMILIVRHFDAMIIIQATNKYLRYCLSYRDIKICAKQEKCLRNFRKAHCGSVRIDETTIKVKGQGLDLRKYLYLSS